MIDFNLIWIWLTYDWKYNFWYGPINYILDTPYRIKWWWQRRTWGWDERDTWDLADSTAKFVLPRLVYLRNNKDGWPNELASEIEWNLILDDIITAFKLIIEDRDFTTIEEYNLTQDKINKGLQLFAKYYQALWT